jgi:hypothetical protein
LAFSYKDYLVFPCRYFVRNTNLVENTLAENVFIVSLTDFPNN